MAQYGNMTLREREDKNKSRKRNEGSQDGSDTGGREAKRSRKLLPKKFDKTTRAKYDGKGLEKDTGLDLCDCLIEDCPGCWLDCPNCGSRKCGHECRVYRRYKYDYIEIEGTNMTIKYGNK